MSPGDDILVDNGPEEKRCENEELQFIRQSSRAGLAAVVTSLIYLGYCFTFLVEAQAKGLRGTALYVAWLSFVMQLGNSIPPATVHLLALSAWGKAKRAPSLYLTHHPILHDTNCPTVDVFITYCGEDISILRDTVRAAIDLDYSFESLRIIILDDSASPEVLRPPLADLWIKKPGIYYTTREELVFYTTRGTKCKTHTKAANLNHGLQYASTLLEGPADFVAVLDVDMIPSPRWLRALIPHLLLDPKVAMVNPPQRHYNIPDQDPLEQSLSGLYEVGEPLKNAIDSAWCVGTGFVVRRSALDDIGGFPEESISEDILTSILLTAAGWKIVYVHEDLQWGLVPSSITAYLQQQVRTCASVISTAAILRGEQAKKMTPKQRYGALFPAFAYAVIVLSNAFNMLVLPWMLWTGEPLVAYTTDRQLGCLCLVFLIKFSCMLHFTLLARRAANHHLGLLGASNTWLIPYQFRALCRFALSVWTEWKVPDFTPSGLTDVRGGEKLGAPKRIKGMLWDNGFLMHAIIISSFCVSALVSNHEAFKALAGSFLGFFEALLVRAAWPPIFLIWSAYIVDCWTPLYYTFRPLKFVEREKLLNRDPKTKVARPTDEAMDQYRLRPSQLMATARIGLCVGFCAIWILVVV